jgi:serine/threonine protein kinase
LSLQLRDLYWVGKTIGRGGFARVRFAQHLESEQATVLKIIQKKKAGHSYKKFVVDAGIYELFLKMSAEDRHTNVVRYFDLLDSPENYYVVMERLEGLPLESALTASGKWSQRCCAAAMADLLKALRHIHIVVGFYHRDVKIENMQYRCKTTLADEHMQCFGDLVLFDYGLARFVDQEWDGGYAGTGLYVAPEVLRELHTENSRKSNTGSYSPAVDIWAAGLLLYALLAGDFPYSEEDLWGPEGVSVRRSGTESVDVSRLVKEAIQELDARSTAEGISIPRALLEGLLDADPASRMDASVALLDPWLTRTNGTVAASLYSAALKKSSASKEYMDTYYYAATARSSGSKEIKVPGELESSPPARDKTKKIEMEKSPQPFKATTHEHQLLRPDTAPVHPFAPFDPTSEDDNNARATNTRGKMKKVQKSKVRYYSAAVMKSSASKETNVPTNEEGSKAAAEYLESLNYDSDAAEAA